MRRDRDPNAFDGAMFLTVCIDDEIARAEARIGEFLEAYYRGRGEMMKKNQPRFPVRQPPLRTGSPASPTPG